MLSSDDIGLSLLILQASGNDSQTVALNVRPHLGLITGSGASVGAEFGNEKWFVLIYCNVFAINQRQAELWFRYGFAKQDKMAYESMLSTLFSLFYCIQRLSAYMNNDSNKRTVRPRKNAENTFVGQLRAGVTLSGSILLSYLHGPLNCGIHASIHEPHKNDEMPWNTVDTSDSLLGFSLTNVRPMA